MGAWGRVEDQWDATGDVAVGSSCLPKAAAMSQKLRVESKGQAKSRGMCWLWEGGQLLQAVHRED